MAWRFKASKYKNSAPVVPKLENQIRDLAIGSYHSHGNYIGASAAFIAFNWDVQGSNLAVLPIDAKGRQNKGSVSLIHAHSDFVTDFEFSPFDDGLLTTGSNDTTVKLWRIPPAGLPHSGLSQPEVTLSSHPRRIETVNFHPAADNILATSSATSLFLWDLVMSQEVFHFPDHEDEVQSVSWETSGKLIASQCKDKTLRVLDPRSSSLAGQCSSHQGIKDSKVVWVGEGQRLLTTGFTSDRCREIIIRDLRNLNQPQKSLTLDSGSGILIPLFDPDTNMCFLAGKGDRNVQLVEITNSDPFIVECLKYSGDQTKGACLVPKRAMDVMQAEVNRVLQLCDSSIVPITWQVPRKSYRDYHADIYPNTNGMEASMGPTDWWKGGNVLVPKISLDPKTRPETLVIFQDKPLSARPSVKKVASTFSTTGNGSNANGNNKNGMEKNQGEKPKVAPRTSIQNVGNMNVRNNAMAGNPVLSSAVRPCLITQDSNQDDSGDEDLALLRRQSSIRDRTRIFEDNIRKSQETPVNTAPKTKPEVSVVAELQKMEVSEKPPKVMFDRSSAPQLRKKSIPSQMEDLNQTSGQQQQPKRPISKAFGRISKFKHLKGDVILKGRFENLKNLSRTMPAECNFVQANSERIALPLTGPGGKVALFEVNKAGRIPDGVTPVLINGASVMDFAFDPFDNSRIVCAGDDGLVRIWEIPQGGLLTPVNEPLGIFGAHPDKCQIVKFHPLAKDVLLTAGFDKLVKIWDLNNTSEAKIVLQGHTEQLFSVEWSKCGKYVATVCRDGKIRIYEPKTGDCQPIKSGGEIVPKKGARVSWAMNDQYLIITGFTKQSERQVSLFRVKDLHEITNMTLDVSPAILRQFFDEDSCTLFLTGKGDSVVLAYEVSTDYPHFFPLSSYRPNGLHQGMAFLPKNVCDVRSVEFARAFRILDNSIEPVSFTVPRLKTDYFQDDLFPPTRVFWIPTMRASEWFAGLRKEAPLISLQPNDMRCLTNSSTVILPEKTMQSSNTDYFQPNRSSHLSKDVEKESKLQESVSKMLHESNKLEQDHMEGVEEKEWED